MRHIVADYNNEKGSFNRYASLSVGAGRAGEALRKDFLDHLQIVEKECGFKYLRFHGIFHEDMGVYREDKNGTAIYNWQYVDIVYDSILEIGLKPFVELGFMPKLLAAGEQTVFWWETNVNPPKEYDKWAALIYNFVIHLKDRYGKDEVSTWYFEVWNEPNHPAFFTGKMQDYFKLYDVTVKVIKDICKDYRVGGPATAAGDDWVSEFIDHCYANKIPVDFVSTHIYGVKGAFDEFGDSVLYLADKDLIINNVKQTYKKVKESPMPDLELHYTEWSSSYSSRDPVHDSYIQAPYVLYNLKRLEGLVDSMSYWTFTDVFEEVGPPPSPFHGGFGLINLQALKKPAFYVYKFIKELGETELANSDEDSWICRNSEGIQALVWNYKHLEQDDSNQNFFTRDLPSEKAEPVTIEIKGMPEGEYDVEVILVGYDSNDVYTDYFKKGLPDTLKKAMVNELDKNNSGLPKISEKIRLNKDEVFKYTLEMRENDIYFVKINR